MLPTRHRLFLWFFATTPRSQRRWGVAAVVGISAGLLSTLVKLGWEQVFPPGVPGRIVEPTLFLNKFGINVHILTYIWSGTTINWSDFIVHFSFSVIVFTFYCVMAEYIPRIKLWQGAA